MTRIATLAANNQLLNILFETQQRVQTSQVQVASEQKSQDYGGIALRSERLVNIENTTALLARFKDQNNIKETELKIAETTLNGVRTTLTDFRDNLLIYESGALDNETRVNAIQDAAFRALKDLEIFLNTDANGEHLFSGARVTTASANLNLSNLGAFQTKFDGEKVVFPITRDALLADFTTTNAATGNLTFAAGPPGTITAATAGSLTNIPIGTTITVASSVSNNKDFTVVANTGTVLTVEGTIGGITSTVTTANVGVIAEGAVAATISATSYYQGDQVQQKHRVSKDRDFTQVLNASDPTFAKAIRAIGIIAQGKFGTNGGLEQTAN